MPANLLNFVAKSVVVALLGFLVIRFLPTIPVNSVVTQKQNLFTVSGTGKVTVVPDTAIIDMGVTTTKGTVKQSQTETNTVINSITAAVVQLGIDKKDIKTSNYSVYPQYDFQSGINRIAGYTVSTNLTIKVRDLEKVNQVIDAGTNNGANSVSGVQLTVDEDKKKELVKQAREQAITEARAKAENLSQLAGMTLGRIVDIQENEVSPVYPLMMAEKAVPMGAGGGADTNIQAGSTDITTSVTLSYETR